MKAICETKRLTIIELQLRHAAFIVSLLNSPGWLKFIGQRNVQSLDEAKAYIQKIINMPQTSYYLVYEKESRKEIGIITILKRAHLEFPDFGFAFLPEYEGKSFAFEAASQLLVWCKEKQVSQNLLAITMMENFRAIELLQRLGFEIKRQYVENEVDLLIYEMKI